MRNGLVQLYSQKNLVDQFQVGDSVLAMYFGKLGFEEQVLVLVTRSKYEIRNIFDLKDVIKFNLEVFI